MAVIYRQISTAVSIITDYKFEIPFHHFLAQSFRKNKKAGSRDRRIIREACYSYFRFGLLFPELSIENKIRLAFWLDGIIEDFPLKHKYNLEKTLVDFVTSNTEIKEIFPCNSLISKEIISDEFFVQQLQLGKVFFKKTPKAKAEDFSEFEEIYENSFVTDLGTSLNEFENKGLIQIQDISSQQLCREIKIGKSVWDVCAGAGGKSFSLKDFNPYSEIFVSDKRKSSLQNLKERARKYAYPIFPNCTADMAQPVGKLEFFDSENRIEINKNFFDTLIIDAPCSGSGTWRRTPENLLNFEKSEIEKYNILQNQIIRNSIDFLKTGGNLFYITCSVFELENESHKDNFEKIGLKLKSSKYYNFRNIGGDVLYCAEYEKVN